MTLPSNSDFDLSGKQYSHLETKLVQQLMVLNFMPNSGNPGLVSIEDDAVIPNGAYIRLESEDGSPDDLVSVDITNIQDDALVFIQVNGGEPDITIKHTVGAGAGEFSLSDGADFVMKGPQYLLVCRKTTTDVLSEMFRWYGVLDDGPAELAEFLGLEQANAHGATLITSSGSYTCKHTGDIVITAVGAGGGGGGSWNTADGDTATAGGDGGDTIVTNGTWTETAAGGDGGGRATNAGGGTAGVAGGTRNARAYVGAPEHLPWPVSGIIDDNTDGNLLVAKSYGIGGKCAIHATTTAKGGAGETGATRTVKRTVTKGEVLTITIGAGGAAGDRSASVSAFGRSQAGAPGAVLIHE